MKKTEIWEWMAAAVCAFFVLCAVFAPYYLFPARVGNALGNTKFVWPENAVWMQMEEGISWGRADEWGFNNRAIDRSPDVLLLGSSHMEAVNVKPGETTAAQLALLFAGEKTIYSMGMSGHDLPEVCHYLPSTLQAFDEPPEYIVIEIRSLSLTREEMDYIYEEPVRQMDTQKGIAGRLKDLPFLSVLDRQMDTGLMDLLLPGHGAQAEAKEEPDEALYGELMRYLASVAAPYGSKLFFLYHRPGTIDRDGGMTFEENPYQAAFTDACAAGGIGFIDMADTFTQIYAQHRIVPYGFITGAANTGHLNAHGHKAAAGEILKAICWTEG